MCLIQTGGAFELLLLHLVAAIMIGVLLICRICTVLQRVVTMNLRVLLVTRFGIPNL